MSDTFTDPIQGIVLEGGGICGLSHIGVVKYLEERKILSQVKYFAGSSAGAMIAGLLACGLSSLDLEKILLNLDFKTFYDSRWFVFSHMYHLYSEFGWNSSQLLEKVYTDILKQYVGDENITLGQIQEKYGSFLIITATSWKHGTIFYTPENSPDLKLVEAIRRSADYPLEFTPCQVKDDILMDGGVLDNLPIEELKKYLDLSQILGSKLISSKLDPPGSSWENPELPQTLEEYIQGILKMYKKLALKAHVSPEDWTRCIKVDVGTVSPMNFDLTLDQKIWLVNQGYRGAQKFFSN